MPLSSATHRVREFSASLQAALSALCQAKLEALEQGVGSSIEREEHILEDLPEEDHKIVRAPLTSGAFAIAPSWVHAAEGRHYLQLDKEDDQFKNAKTNTPKPSGPEAQEGSSSQLDPKDCSSPKLPCFPGHSAPTSLQPGPRGGGVPNNQCCNCAVLAELHGEKYLEDR
ncbi:hypothetical protein DSO57_1002091 [Entomophthora muscae]|uniref:Uncharacterized protein n=1 Tax=Entomophthora muscae TaxID=34485 RepID=A0ACC2RZZ7_9FUNG|nr:hypothetical protein DSO57_1002091 [Entomophthora muscae]